MEVIFLEIGQVEDSAFKFAVISARMKGKWIFVKHRERDTWEIPGGHRESGEHLDETARRELYEETGAQVFDIKPVCDYGVTHDNEISYGRLYMAEIQTLGDLPEMEIGEVALFDKIPEQLTYPAIQPHLYHKILQEITCDNLGKG